jgi:hypothetical protein
VIRARFRETIREGFLPEVEENGLRMVVRDKRQAEPGSPGHEISILALSCYSVFKIERQIWDLRVNKKKKHFTYVKVREFW